MTQLTAEAVADRLAAVRRRIVAAGGDVDRVTVVAVTKGFGPEAVRAALGAGIHDIGENFAQELVAKARALGAEAAAARFHFVGQLQRNKVRLVAPLVSLYQSVDRARLGREIAARAPGARVLVQVNLTDDPARGGCPPADVPALVTELGDAGLDVLGLMAVAPIGPAETARAGFATVRELAERLGLPERSYGMTDDLEAAVAEATTMVRLGTALFGPRPSVRGAKRDVEH
jgi:pyridoxal phosphate enzyme (YggS family)